MLTWQSVKWLNKPCCYFKKCSQSVTEPLRHCPQYASLVMGNWCVCICVAPSLRWMVSSAKPCTSCRENSSQLSHCQTLIFTQRFKTENSVVAAFRSLWTSAGRKPSVKTRCDCCVCTAEHLLDRAKLQQMSTEDREPSVLPLVLRRR